MVASQHKRQKQSRQGKKSCRKSAPPDSTEPIVEPLPCPLSFHKNPPSSLNRSSAYSCKAALAPLLISLPSRSRLLSSRSAMGSVVIRAQERATNTAVGSTASRRDWLQRIVFLQPAKMVGSSFEPPSSLPTLSPFVSLSSPFGQP